MQGSKEGDKREDRKKLRHSSYFYLHSSINPSSSTTTLTIQNKNMECNICGNNTR